MAPEGMINAVCVDVIDVGQAMGVKPDEFGRYIVPVTNPSFTAKPRCKFVFELETKMDDGRPFTQYIDLPASFYKPEPGQTGQTAKMRDQLDNWGIKLPDDLSSVDLIAMLLGKQATLRIIHELDKGGSGRMWANISTINPSNKVVEPSGQWDADAARKRIKDKALADAVKNAVKAAKSDEADDSDVPF